MANHLRFVGRTVMVQNGNVEAAYGVLNRTGQGLVPEGPQFLPVLGSEPEFLEQKACRRVYSAEMARRIAFLARSSRQDPWLGC
ncbi:RT21 protein, partial [Illadopsis cleaveri]|nr:RT21 protein [Illadopsis cleaveri]